MPHSKRITTALLLAAGTGSRLRPLTNNAPKCLTEIGGRTILGRLIDSLRSQGIVRLVVVTGHMDQRIREFLDQNASDMQIDYVFNPVYKTTNNIYSLWLARNIIQDDFMLIESDLVFDAPMLTGLLRPDTIAISRILPWMNGTTVELNDKNRIAAFHMKQSDISSKRYKTVNICSLSLLSWQKVVGQLDQYIAGNRVGEYYEAVFADMVASGTLNFDAVLFDENRWYEIDTVEDLYEADKYFSPPFSDAG